LMIGVVSPSDASCHSPLMNMRLRVTARVIEQPRAGVTVLSVAWSVS
jgi:hypothetical protein